MIVDYKIVPFHFFYEEKTRYKVRIKKQLWGWLRFWAWLEDYNNFDEETGEYKLRFFNSEEEVHEFMKSLIKN